MTSFLPVNRGPILYDFRAGAEGIRYSLNLALILDFFRKWRFGFFS